MSRVKPVFKCIASYKEKFKESRCALTISVGQKAHEGEIFEATVDLVNTSFKSCIILLDDTLQRHTMALNLDECDDYFYKTALKEGDLWLKRNEVYYNKLTILEDILRWDTWLKHPAFNDEKNKIESFIESDPLYKAVFDETIDEFLRRYTHRLDKDDDFNIEKARKYCSDYLIEECAIICLRPKLNLACHFDVYPSRRNLAMSETHTRFVLPNYPNLLLPVAIKFKNRTTLYPQRFELLHDVTQLSVNTG